MRLHQLVSCVLALTTLCTVAQADSVRAPCVADCNISAYPGEQTLNYGGSTRLRLKGIQMLALLRFDLAGIGRRPMVHATLHMRHADQVRCLRTIGLSAVAAHWQEGTGTGTADGKGATFLEREARLAWAGPQSDLTDATFTGSGAPCWYQDLRDEADGWIAVDVPLDLVRAMRDGNSDGMAVSDEKGQTMANNDLYSREQSGSAPYLLIETAAGADEGRQPAMVHTAASRPAAPTATPVLPPLPPSPYHAIAPQIVAHGLSVTVLFETELDPAHAGGSPWNGSAVHLAGARGEAVAFVLAMRAESAGRAAAAAWAAAGGLAYTRVFRVEPVAGTPEVCVPFTGMAPVPTDRDLLLYVEAMIPQAANPGTIRAAIGIGTAAGGISIPVQVDVNRLAMPLHLGFEVSLNTYGTVGGPYHLPDNTPAYLDLERAYHRIAHEHRGTLAILGYSHSGNTSTGYAPPITGTGTGTRVADWSAWDTHFGPYLDGSAFTGLPRGPIPVTHLYLTVHENWPATMADHYHYSAGVTGYPAMITEHAMRAAPVEETFDRPHGEAITTVLRQVAEHAAQKGWKETRLQFYLNNKHYYKDPAQGGRGVCWWLLDEPMSRDDWLAIAYFARLNRRAAGTSRRWPISFREDISRPQWQRGMLDGLVDLMVVSSELFAKPRLLADIKARIPCTVWNYGSAEPPGLRHTWAEAWAVRAWLAGADGIVPWQSVGEESSLDKPEATALIVPGTRYGVQGPLATIRLKALRRAQQTAEYLVQWAAASHTARETIAAILGTSPGADLGEWTEARFAALRSAAARDASARDAARQ